MNTTKYRYVNHTGYNALGSFAETTRWTEVTKYCYKRHCICEGCLYSQFFSNKNKCKAKAHVLALVSYIGKPKGIDLCQVKEDN
jgi:hypothetical protein